MLLKTKGFNGNYKFGSTKLKSTRYQAYKQLLPGGEFRSSLYPTLKELADLRRNEYSDLDWKMQNILCAKRLYLYLETGLNIEAKVVDQDHYDEIVVYIKQFYSLDEAQIKELMENDSITPEYLDS